mmetsp:Transcript_25831/g.62452  ORF Transcript_25831/g.62452 Transcript_25831/m.62452 type:complete len:325 (-) Transcript_25831:57-1031(-)
MSIPQGGEDLLRLERFLVVGHRRKPFLIPNPLLPILNALLAQLRLRRLPHQHRDVMPLGVLAIPCDLGVQVAGRGLLARLETLGLESSGKVVHVLHGEPCLPPVAVIRNYQPRPHDRQARLLPLFQQATQSPHARRIIFHLLHLGPGVHGSRHAALDAPVQRILGAAPVSQSLHVPLPLQHGLLVGSAPDHTASVMHALPSRRLFELNLAQADPTRQLPQGSYRIHGPILIQVHLELSHLAPVQGHFRPRNEDLRTHGIHPGPLHDVQGDGHGGDTFVVQGRSLANDLTLRIGDCRNQRRACRGFQVLLLQESEAAPTRCHGAQ